MMSVSLNLLPGQARRLAWCAALALGAACGTADEPPALPNDLARDLSLASSATSATSPVPDAFGDTAATSQTSEPTPEPAPEPAAAPPPVRDTRREPAPAPAARPPKPTQAPTPTPSVEPTRPAPAPAPPPAAEVESAPGRAPRTLLALGAVLTGTTATRVCTTSNRPGDRLVMRLTDDVTGADGTVLTAGTSVLLEVAAVDSVLTLRVRSVHYEGELLPITATASVESEMEGSRAAAKGSDMKKVIGGAILGGLLGHVLGGDTRSTVIGATGGAAAGTVVARRSGASEQCLPEGAIVRVVLDAPLMMNGSGM